MELIKPQKQKVWKWPAVVNFTCGGIGTGFYLLTLLVPLTKNGDWLSSLLSNGDWFSLAFQAAVFKLLGPAFVAIGFAALTTEAGRPQRGINLFRHLRRSWMSRETLAFAIFAPFAALDWLVPNPILRAIAAFGAIFLIFCQGMIPYRARGVTAWNVSLMPIYFVTAGFATGGGLLLVVMMVFGLGTLPVAQTLVGTELIALMANLLVWALYITRGEKDFRFATQELRSGKYLVGVAGVGCILPTLLLLGFASSPIAVAVAGLLALFGGAMQKWGIVIDAGYLRAIVLSAPKKFSERFVAAK